MSRRMLDPYAGSGRTDPPSRAATGLPVICP